MFKSFLTVDKLRFEMSKRPFASYTSESNICCATQSCICYKLLRIWLFKPVGRYYRVGLSLNDSPKTERAIKPYKLFPPFYRTYACIKHVRVLFFIYFFLIIIIPGQTNVHVTIIDTKLISSEKCTLLHLLYCTS